MSSNSSINSSIVSQKPAASADTPMLTPEQVIEQLRALRSQIPEFVEPPDGQQMRKLRDAARPTVELVHESVNAIGASEFVREFIGSTPDDLRHVEDEASRWTSVETEIRSLLGGVVASNLIRRQRVAKAVKEAYNLSRTLVQQERYAHLRAHVDTMFRRHNRKRAKPAPPPDDQKKQ
jgi:hypothetical protein